MLIQNQITITYVCRAIDNSNLDVIGIAETHLIRGKTLETDNYMWFGHNRQDIHVRAKSGSGGVGLLIRRDLVDYYEVCVVENSTEGILWVKFQSKVDCSKMYYVCVCYLPPEGTSRNVNVHDFYDNLLSDIYSIPHNNLFFICGDFNSRCSNMEDFIRGIDVIPERNVIDFYNNSYGDIFIDFLTNANLCILNGRNCIRNDFTFVSTRGLSVVDYCLVPYERLVDFSDFSVTRASALVELAGCVGTMDIRTIPDHSLLFWNMSVNMGDDSSGGVPLIDRTRTDQARKSYDTTSIPRWVYGRCRGVLYIGAGYQQIRTFCTVAIRCKHHV